ncbi:unnamed protein product, partial [Lampetra planeri]
EWGAVPPTGSRGTPAPRPGVPAEDGGTTWLREPRPVAVRSRPRGAHHRSGALTWPGRVAPAAASAAAPAAACGARVGAGPRSPAQAAGAGSGGGPAGHGDPVAAVGQRPEQRPGQHAACQPGLRVALHGSLSAPPLLQGGPRRAGSGAVLGPAEIQLHLLLQRASACRQSAHLARR